MRNPIASARKTDTGAALPRKALCNHTVSRPLRCTFATCRTDARLKRARFTDKSTRALKGARQRHRHKGNSAAHSSPVSPQMGTATPARAACECDRPRIHIHRKVGTSANKSITSRTEEHAMKHEPLDLVVIGHGRDRRVEIRQRGRCGCSVVQRKSKRATQKNCHGQPGLGAPVNPNESIPRRLPWHRCREAGHFHVVARNGCGGAANKFISVEGLQHETASRLQRQRSAALEGHREDSAEPWGVAPEQPPARGPAPPRPSSKQTACHRPAQCM